MTDRSDLVRRANEFRQLAEVEADENVRHRLARIADHYAHLAESKAWTEAHPADAARLADVFMNRS